jgi:hypothetical protein
MTRGDDMASSSKKSKDPTEVALSAIQDALKVGEGEQPATVDAVQDTVPDFLSARPRSAAATGADEDLFLDRAGTSVREDAARHAANDDRATMGQVLHSLQRRPARTPYTLAAICSFVWVMCALGLLISYSSDFAAALSQGAAAAPLVVFLLTVVCGPIFFFFVLAQIFSRSQELRIIAQSMAEVALRLAEPEAVAHDSIVSVGQAVRREVAAMGDGVERALARASELEALVNNEVASLERVYSENEVRIRSLIDGLSQQRDTLAGQSEQVRSAISNVHLQLSQDITKLTEMVAERINDAGQHITRTLAEKGEHVTNALGTAGESMVETISNRGGDLVERLRSASAESAGAIVNATDQLTASLNIKTDHIATEVTQIASTIRDAMTARLDGVMEGFSQRTDKAIDTMEQRSRALTDAIVDTSSRIAETIASRSDEVNNTLKATGDSLVLDLGLRGGEVIAKLEQTGSKIAETIIQRSDKMGGGFRESAAALAATIDAQGEAVHALLSQRLQAFEQTFGHDSSALGNLITHHLAEFDRTVKTYGGELVERLSGRTQEVTQSLRGYLEGFDSGVTAKAAEVTASLDQRLAQFQGALENRTQNLADSIAARGAAIADTFGTRATEVAEALDGRITRFENLLIGRAETVAKEIETRTATATELLSTRMEQLAVTITDNAGAAERSLGALTIATADTLRTSAAEVEHSLTSLSNGVTTVLKENASDVERTLLGVTSEVARTFVGRADEIADAVTKRSAELTQILDEKSSELLAAIGGKSTEFTREVTRVTDQAVKTIEAKGFTFTSTMMDNSQQLARIINDAGENATRSVNEKLLELQRASEDAVEQSKQMARSTVTEIIETHGMLSSDSTALFERLREANVLLREVMAGAQENMGSIEHLLSTRVSEFVSTMDQLIERTGTTTGRMDENISAFYTLSSKVLGDLSDLAKHFEGHGQMLASAVELVDKSNHRAEESVKERREALETLLTTLNGRSEDFDQRLKRFSSLLEESLAAAEVRARDISRVVADSTSNGVRMIAEQYDLVRATAEDERKRTNATMRGIYEQATGDAHAMLHDTMERFTEIMENMKHMSTEMQRELEETRQELRRGVLELPQETAESAAQMRRVIVDQIEALAELNRIVARHGRSFDTTEPGRRGAQEPALAGVGGGRGEAANGGAPPPPPHARRPEAPQRSRGGWLSDLLSRASREPEEPPHGDDRAMFVDERPRDDRFRDDRSPLHTIESLDSLSVDIARMIDHDAAAELWDRYNRGEHNVFTRRLYTMQGQKTFDEIRKRYRGDREFKQTVDRYIGEFERLLDEVSQDDRGQVVVRTYLTSETGKVYTMLAHAAGRFD